MSIEVASYRDQLLTTRQQLDVLREYNRRYWAGHFSAAELAALEVSDEFPTLDNLPVVHAEFGSAWDTIDAWKNVYLDSEITHWNTLPSTRRDFDSFIRQHAQTAHYKPGLRIVHMDLTRDGDRYRSMRELYAAAEETPDMLLAHSEGLALVGLHRAFRESAEGYARRHTPYLPGYQARNVFVSEAWAGDWDWAARFDYGRPHQGWGLRVFPTAGDRSIQGSLLLVRGGANAQ
jgi:hypothetical protein